MLIFAENFKEKCVKYNKIFMIQGRYFVHTRGLCCNTKEEGKFAL